MRRNVRTFLLVAVAVTAVFASGLVLGDDRTFVEPAIEVPSFSVEVAVTPMTGPMRIPPANPPSWPFTVFVRIRDSEVGSLWSMHEDTVYAGDQVREGGEYGPYRITCIVEIDERGESAGINVRIVRMDGTEPVQIMNQKFVAHLPRSQGRPD